MIPNNFITDAQLNGYTVNEPNLVWVSDYLLYDINNICNSDEYYINSLLT